MSTPTTPPADLLPFDQPEFAEPHRPASGWILRPCRHESGPRPTDTEAPPPARREPHVRTRAAEVGALICAFLLAAVSSVRAADGLDQRVIAVPGTDITVKLWEAPGPRGDRTPHYAVSDDGVTFRTARATSYEIKLRHGDFDPLGAVPPRPVADRLAAGADTDLSIVQFVTQPLQAYRDAITALGGEVSFFLANHSHLVKMDATAREAVAALPYVRWIGPYHPAYRLEDALARGVDGSGPPLPTQRYNVMLTDARDARKLAVAARIDAIGGTVDRVRAGKYLLEATLTADQLLALVRWDEVLVVDVWSPYEADMDIAREIGGANFIELVDGYDGQGVRGEVLDVGFNVGHEDFASRPLIEHTPISQQSHGASTSGIVFGDGSGSAGGRGLLPKGQGIVASWDFASTGPPRYDHTGELLQAPYFAVFQTASVGSARTTEYTTITADTDAMLFDFDIVHCQSQSNAGDQMSRPQAWAKNVISGGGVRHQNTLDRSDDCWCGGASIGPASDGRIKPDLCHFYDSIFTVTCCGPNSYTSSFGGTSGATPIIAGHVGLFFQMWSDGIFGNPVDDSHRVFQNRSHMTTAKAMLINTANSYEFAGTSADLTRTNQGWGMPDLRAMYELRDSMLIVDETVLLANMESAVYEVGVAGGEPAFRATLVYADPPGVPASSQHRINDLSLRVTAPSGTSYWGNNGLHTGNWSVPGGFANDVDTVENVFVQAPEAGVWTVEVLAAEVNEDGHVETPQLDADFALVVSGVEPPVAACAADLDGSGAVDFADVLAVLSLWGPCPACPEDLDGSGDVGFADLLDVLSQWGPCP